MTKNANERVTDREREREREREKMRKCLCHDKRTRESVSAVIREPHDNTILLLTIMLTYAQSCAASLSHYLSLILNTTRL